MKNFAHVSDEGVRSYLEHGSDDYNVVAKQLDALFRSLNEDATNEHIPFDVIERREEAYDEACEYFGWRNLIATHEAIKKFWEV